MDWGYDGVDFDSDDLLLPDWRSQGDGMQDNAGHRIAMLDAKYTEVGISAIGHVNPWDTVGPWVVTEDFGARSGYVPQLVGVIFYDADGDRFYAAGEGLGGITVTATRDGKSYSTLAWSSGGYQIELSAGTYEVTFSGGGLAAPVTRTITIGGQNLKLDLNTDDVPTDPNAVLGGSGNDWLNAKTFGHLINGFDGVDMASFVAATGWDTAIYSGKKADYTTTYNADHSISVLHLAGGTDGVDVLVNIEALQFSDGRLFL